MLDKQEASKVTEYLIDGKIQKGKVLAVANYVDRQMICFCIQGQTVGRWIQVDPKIIEQPSHNWTDIISTLLRERSHIQFERYQTEVKEIIAQKKGLSKADLSNEVIKTFVERSVNGSIYKILIKSLGYVVVSQEILNPTLDLLMSKINFVDNTSQEDADFNSICENISSSMKEIASEILSTIDIGKNILDQSKYIGLLLELVYKIGCVYGYDHRKESEFIAILSIALGTSIIKEIGVNSVITSTSMPQQFITPLSNIITFSVVGYASICYYQSATNIQKQELISKLQTYTQNNSFLNQLSRSA